MVGRSVCGVAGLLGCVGTAIQSSGIGYQVGRVVGFGKSSRRQLRWPKKRSRCMEEQLIGAISSALEQGELDQVAYLLAIGVEEAQMQGDGEMVALLNDLLLMTQQTPGVWIELWREALVEVDA